MNFDFTSLLQASWPLLVLLGGAFLSLMVSIVPSQRSVRMSALVAVLSLIICAYGFFISWQEAESFHLASLRFDSLSQFLSLVLILLGLITVLFSFSYWEKLIEPIHEAIPLILFALLGMLLMVSTTHLLTLILSLELMSLCLYILVGVKRSDPRSSEAAFKYFLLGSVAAAFMLFGAAMFYGATGSLEISVLFGHAIPASRAFLFYFGVVLLLLGFIFKIAAFPLHFWAPDVYDGAPIPVTGFMAAGVKVAAFGALVRLVSVFGAWEYLNLEKGFLALSIMTMVVGNLTALRQRSIKRIMAYSSIAHAGYLLLGIAVMIKAPSEGLSSVLFYLFVYGVITLGSFVVLTYLSSQDSEISELDDLNGLSSKRPFLSAALSIFLLSLAGIPPTAGFFAKYYLFSQAMFQGFYLAAIIGILTSAVSLYYYLAPVVRLYFYDAGEVKLPVVSVGIKTIVAILLVGVFYLGLFPGSSLEWAKKAAISSKVIGHAQKL